jgi:glycerol uptake facilitator-like aquaporin
MVTFILVLVVYGVCDSRRTDIGGSVPLIIGLTVTLSHLLSVSIAGIFDGWPNGRIFRALITVIVYFPDRLHRSWLEPCSYSWTSHHHWTNGRSLGMRKCLNLVTNRTLKYANMNDFFQVYFVGPFLGGAVAGILYTVLFKAKAATASEDF